MAQLADDPQADNDDDVKGNAEYDPKDTADMFEKYQERYLEFEKTIGFPIDTNNIFNEDFDNEVVYKHMTQTYPVCHGSILLLAHRFILMKQNYGTDLEKKLYANMTLTDLFNRITTKRAVVFYNASDDFMLRNGKRSGRGWENVGTTMETYDEWGVGTESLPKLEDYLSYDELMLSALCGVSSPTHFINTGDRGNRGRVNPAIAHEPEGIYMGLIGARFEKTHRMEYSLMVIASNQNSEDMGYGKFVNDKHRESLLDRVEKATDDDYFLDQVKKAQTASEKKKKPIFTLMESFYSRPYFPTYSEVESNFNNEEQKQDAAEQQKWQNRYFQAPGYSRKYLDKGVDVDEYCMP